MTKDRTIELFDELLRIGLGDELAPGATTFLGMIAEDAVMEFPYAPSGFPRVFSGRSEIQRHLDNLKGLLRIDRFTAPKIHRTNDGFVLEFSCTGQASQTGYRYDQDFISVITLHNGRISRYRDYWNPLIVLEAITPKTENAAEAH